MSIHVLVRHVVGTLNAWRMEIVTHANVCRISLVNHPTVDQSVFQILNALIVWLASINIVRIRVRLMFVAKMLNVMSLVILRFVNVSEVMLAIHSFIVLFKKLRLNTNHPPIRAYQAHVVRMLTVAYTMILAHVNVLPIIMVIHTKAADQNVY